MQRDTLLLTKMIDAAEQAQQLAAGLTVNQLRNRIVHGYWSIDLDVLQTTADKQLAAFIADLRGVLSRLDQGT